MNRKPKPISPEITAKEKRDLLIVDLFVELKKIAAWKLPEEEADGRLNEIVAFSLSFIDLNKDKVSVTWVHEQFVDMITPINETLSNLIPYLSKDLQTLIKCNSEAYMERLGLVREKEELYGEDLAAEIYMIPSLDRIRCILKCRSFVIKDVLAIPKWRFIKRAKAIELIQKLVIR